MATRTSYIGMGFTILVLLGGCGPGLDEARNPGAKSAAALSASERAYADKLFRRMDANGDGFFQRSEVRCLANVAVDKIGVGPLQSAGIERPATAGDDVSDNPMLKLSSDDRRAYMEAFTTCVNLKQAFVRGVREDGTSDPELADCLDKVIDDNFETDFAEFMLMGSATIDASGATTDDVPPEVRKRGEAFMKPMLECAFEGAFDESDSSTPTTR